MTKLLTPDKLTTEPHTKCAERYYKPRKKSFKKFTEYCGNQATEKLNFIRK